MRGVGRTVFGVLALAACGADLPVGTERGPCFPNSTCYAGLTCLSELCVRRIVDGAPLTPLEDATAQEDRMALDTTGSAGDVAREDRTVQDASPTDRGSLPDTGMGVDVRVVPTLEGDLVPLFNRSCGATTDGCHSRESYNANSGFGCRGWLSLENLPLGARYNSGPNLGRPTGCPDRDLYERLTGLACQQCDERSVALVAPRNAAGSYLLRKINGGPYCPFPGQTGASNPMPMGAPLPADQIDLVRRWIEAGAPRR